ncbi:MAG: hypothetical protein RLZZ524_476 [Pseudomonadota bacterium]
MKLFIWHDVLFDYTGGIAFAMAPDVDAAREAVAEAFGRCDEYAGQVEEARARILREISGEPDEVHDAPAAGYCWGGG